jgi:predicted methyltransferase
MRKVVIAALLMVLAGCTAVSSSTSGGSSAAGTARPEADVARDEGRQPYAVLDFLGVEPGMTTMDVMAAGGYYTEVLANVVGPEGLVYAQNPAIFLRFGGGRNDRALTDRLAGNRLPNVRRLDREFDDLGLVQGSVDVAITALNLHDLYNRDPAAAQGVLMAIGSVVKPGGVIGIIDHVGNAGADNASLHRMDPADAVAAAEAAGFSVEQSSVLANPADDHTQGPFAEGLRGYTDRFVLKLTKVN